MLHSVHAEAAVAAESLTVVRGDTEVLHGLSFTVPRGGITGLLGPSGCGKTTLIRCVVGVQIIESGGVDVLGAPAGSAELRPRVGALDRVTSDGSLGGGGTADVLVTCSVILLALGLGAATPRRRTA
jgi:ABC-type cobalamin/Fe3+-siderophores transport system ATPase subunit